VTGQHGLIREVACERRFAQAMSADNVEKIAALNDEFRRTGEGGQIVVTAAFNGLPPAEQAYLFRQVRLFDEFNAANDPYGEHDFGSFEYDGQRINFKIDYYDENLEYGSEDPADPDKTTRVLTIGLANDF
jgi:hypothetical protein